MAILTVNFLAYLWMFIHIYKKQGGFTVNAWAYCFFAIIAFLGLLVYNTDYYAWGPSNEWGSRIRNEMSFIPLALVFLGFYIYYYSIKNVNSNEINSIVPLAKWADNWLYYFNIALMLGVIAIYGGTAAAISDLNDAYATSRGDDSITSQSTIGSYMRIICAGLGYFQIIYPFYLLSKNKKKDTNRALVFFIIMLVCRYIESKIAGSRGMIFFLFADLFMAYIIFKNMLPTKTKKRLIVGAICALSIFASLVLAISIARFGSTDFAMWIVSYFGEPFLNFPLIYWKPPFFMDGELLAGIFTGESVSSYRGFDFYYFKTLFGFLYLDFATFGALLFLVTLSLLQKKILGKVQNEITLYQMMVYAYIAMTFTFGIFGLKVYGWSGYAILVLLYIYLKLGTLRSIQINKTI